MNSGRASSFLSVGGVYHLCGKVYGAVGATAFTHTAGDAFVASVLVVFKSEDGAETLRHFDRVAVFGIFSVILGVINSLPVTCIPLRRLEMPCPNDEK